MTPNLFAPLITPFSTDERIDFAALESNVAKYETTPLSGFLVNGSSGEAEMLTVEERTELARVVVACASRPVLVGIVASSVYDLQSQIESLADLDVEGLLIRTPGYYGAQFDQVDFFTKAADLSPHPVLVYQIPQYTGVKLTGSEMSQIAAHPNIVGIKDSLGDLSLLNEVTWPDDFRYYLGASGLLQPGMSAGAFGGILALANVVPDHCAQLIALSRDSTQTKKAREFQGRLIPLNRALGGSRGFGLAGLKYACELSGYKSGVLRSPLRPISSQGMELIEFLMRDLPVI